MSRIGKMPIKLPSGVAIKIDGQDVTVSGPKGMLIRTLNPAIGIEVNGDVVRVTRQSDDRYTKALHGLARSLLANMVEGVSHGFEKELEIVGVGYRVEQSGENIALKIGFSHPVVVQPMGGVSLTAVGTNKIKVSGADKEAVGQMAANIRAISPPDSYKGKGIRYAGEVIKLKAGKAGKAIGGKK